MANNLPPWLETALARFNISHSRKIICDQLIDILIGLEALYLNENTELSFRLAIRAAIHQESDPAARWKKFNQLRFLYEARSKIVHGGNIELDSFVQKNKSPYKTIEELISSAREILRKGCYIVLLHRVQSGDWDNDFYTNLDKSIFYNQ